MTYNSEDASVDPFAGFIINGKLVYSEDEAGDNLSRSNYDFTYNNYGVLDDNILTFGFWDSINEVLSSYYINSTGQYALSNDAVYSYLGYFEAFTAAQQAMTAGTLQMWDDLINISFERVENAAQSDIPFGFTLMSLAAGAHAYLPSGSIYDAADAQYGFVESGRISGDVWANWYLNSPTGDDAGQPLNRPVATHFSELAPGDYAWFAIMHEVGHSLGLSHGGDYNASDDNNGDGKPDPITYGGDAYFFQDSEQYTIMSYFGAYETGADWIDWSTGGWYVRAQTPMVHDVLAVQEIYGADMTTRTGDTTYGFNSNAGNVVFDFSRNEVPVFTVWDAAGNDTFDFSGYVTNSIIDLNEGAFSSAGHGIYEHRDALGIPNFTQAQANAYAASQGLGDGGRPEDNIAIAYGAKIENAIGGAGNDKIIGNDLDNVLIGNGGDDVITGALGNDMLDGGAGADTMTGGVGNDLYVVGETGDLVVESSNQGIDAVQSSIDYTLTGNVENLALTGSAIRGTGNGLDNILVGNSAANVLNGGAGQDRLVGGDGVDRLIGGAGKDTFVAELNSSKLATKRGDLSLDMILDFNGGEGDKIDLSGIDFNGGAAGKGSFNFVGKADGKNAGDVSWKSFGNVNAAENALGLDLDDAGGPVSVIFGHTDNDGVADFALVLYNTSTVTVDHLVNQPLVP